jgi:hypothetical protein
MDELGRITEQLMGRMIGPMNFRLVVQPLVATFLAVRAGIKDAHNHKPPFLSELFTGSGNKKELLRSAWKDIGQVFIFAFLLDAIYQIFVLKYFYLPQSLLVAFALAILPYILLRGPITRLSAKFRKRSSVKQPTRGKDK